jgi:hypothetical protein
MYLTEKSVRLLYKWVNWCENLDQLWTFALLTPIRDVLPYPLPHDITRSILYWSHENCENFLDTLWYDVVLAVQSRDSSRMIFNWRRNLRSSCHINQLMLKFFTSSRENCKNIWVCNNWSMPYSQSPRIVSSRFAHKSAHQHRCHFVLSDTTLDYKIRKHPWRHAPSIPFLIQWVRSENTNLVDTNTNLCADNLSHDPEFVFCRHKLPQFAQRVTHAEQTHKHKHKLI